RDDPGPCRAPRGAHRRRGRGNGRPRRRRRASARGAAELRLRGRGEACRAPPPGRAALGGRRARRPAAARLPDARRRRGRGGCARLRRGKALSDPPAAVLWNLLRGALATRVLGIVAELGIADALADGPRPVSDLARESGADADMLHRSLRALASDGIFVETCPGVFGNTDASELLRSETGWSDFAHLCGGPWHRAAGELDADGRPTF